MLQNNFYKIYKLTFPNGKCYIGQTSVDIEHRGALGAGYKTQPVYQAILQFGWNNIKKEILIDNLTQSQANDIEQNYIQLYDSINNGYNRAKGNTCARTIVNNCKNNNPQYMPNYHYSNIIAENYAMKTLTHAALKLFLYFNQNSNVPNFHISFPQAKHYTNISESSFYRAMTELKEKGYLVEDEETHALNFYEIPLLENISN